jgi:hypothetical protein
MAESPMGPSDTEVLGGWDRRYARVVRVFATDDVALALVDTNGDNAEVMAEAWQRDEDQWSPASSTSFGSIGSNQSGWAAARSGRVVWAAGERQPDTIVHVRYLSGVHDVLADDQGLWGWVGQADEVDGELPRPV